MSATVAYEGEINSIVREYLILGKFNETAKRFDQDCLERGTPIASNDSHNDYNDCSAILENFMKKFVDGQSEKFFQLWVERVPDELRNKDSIAQKLEFYLNIYFAIYPFKFNLKDKDERMKKLQRYLTTKGDTLSKSPELSTFFALPFVPDPKTHAQFKELFADKWTQSLESRVEKFLKSVLQSSPTPRIVHIYNASLSSNKVIENLSQEVLFYKQKLSNCNKLFNKTKLDYNNLLDVTANIIDSLEASVQGNPVTPEYVQKLYEKLFSNQMRQTTDFNRPGTASKTLRESMAINSRNGSRIRSLNYKNLKMDMASSNERQMAFILQALRWRLSRSGTSSGSILQEYISNDIFGCSGDKKILKITVNNLSGDNLMIRLYTVILLNLITSFNQGRIYLMQNMEIIEMLIDKMKEGNCEMSEKENIISLLQKLSLCGTVQMLMINKGIIEYCVHSLQNIDDLSENSVTYTLALLMNLSLRTKGKKNCVKICDDMLVTLSNLMQNDQLELESQGYINGILYAICALPEMREKAREMGMVDILKSILMPERGEMNTQIEYLIRSINSKEYKNQEVSDHEDDPEDFDVESLEKLDLSSDEEMLRSRPGELSGDEFLEKYFEDVDYNSPPNSSLKRQTTSENIHIRPATPRKSMIFSESNSKREVNSSKSNRLVLSPTESGHSNTNLSQITQSTKSSAKTSKSMNKPKKKKVPTATLR